MPFVVDRPGTGCREFKKTASKLNRNPLPYTERGYRRNEKKEKKD